MLFCFIRYLIYQVDSGLLVIYKFISDLRDRN